MAPHFPKLIRFRGREEPVLDRVSVRGRDYFLLERLSRRGAWRVFTPQAGPEGNYRILYRLPHCQLTRQKIETLRRLAGPTANRNFPAIVDFARQGSEFVIVVEWIWGISLLNFLRAVRAGTTPRPSLPQVVRLLRGLAHGLSHYHRRTQLVHGDVSPANLIVTTGTSQLVLIDFGSAWPQEQSAHRQPGDGSTPPYAAPERIGRQALVDFRADQFSLAVVGYELLTLEIPFDGIGGRAGLPEYQTAFAQTWVPPSSKLSYRDRLPASSLILLDELFRVSLALHPDGRYPTRSAWLAAWDQLHVALRPGGRLAPLENWCLGWLDTLTGWFSRKQ